MNKLQQKLTKEIEKQEAKGPARHRVEGYRQTEGARALLEGARSRQKWATEWRRKAIRAEADSVRYVYASMRNFSVKAAIFSKDGVDVLLLAPTRANWIKADAEELARYENGEEYLRAQYFRVRSA